ncbi:MAG: hypothetical protein ACOY3Y_02020 [Acidobacteriota bacterium]
MLALLAPAAVAVCLTHPAGLDREIGRRSLPWLPPDLARQVVKHERDFTRGMEAAAAWPASYHRSGAGSSAERAITTQCERLVAAIRGRKPFAEVVSGLGALAHFAGDLAAPFPPSGRPDPHADAFARYLGSAAPRVPLVFYGQATQLIRSEVSGLAPLLHRRRSEADALAPFIRVDLDRVGGPGAWRRLDDRSTGFAAASLVLNHATSDYVNLASWVWHHAGGAVPPVNGRGTDIFVWRGEPIPRQPALYSRKAGRSRDEAGTHLGFR